VIRWARVDDEEGDAQFILHEPTKWESENIANFKGTFRFAETMTFKKVRYINIICAIQNLIMRTHTNLDLFSCALGLFTNA